MSPHLGKKTAAQPQTIVLADVGSGSVGAALIEIVRNKPPNILIHKRIGLKLQPGRNAASLEERVFKALHEALQQVRAHGVRRKVRHIAAFLPAPWSALSLHKVRFAENRAFLANTALMNRLIQEHVQHEQQVQETSQSTQVFERVIAGLRLNGYVAPSLPQNAKVFRIEMMLAAARAPEAMLARMHAVLSESFAGAPVTLHSSSLAAAHALAAIAADTPSFLLCDGEGELAELVAVRDTIPEAHATIPVGYATIVRTLATHSGITHEEIPSLLALVADARSPLFSIAAEAIAHAEHECAQALGASEPLCAALSPRVCYIIGDGPEATWFGRALQYSPRLRSVLPPDFTVRVVTAASLQSEVAFAGLPAQTGVHSRAQGDVMLALEAIYASDRFGGKGAQNFYLH